jgi:hypothetical protein
MHRYKGQQMFIDEDNQSDCYPVNANFLNDGSVFPTAMSAI